MTTTAGVAGRSFQRAERFAKRANLWDRSIAREEP
jgi:hypothetical protein